LNLGFVSDFDIRISDLFKACAISKIYLLFLTLYKQMLEAKHNKLPLFLTLSLLVHIIFLCVRSQDAVLAPIRAPRNDHAICISLKNVTLEGPSREMMEQKITPYRASPADIKPLPPVDKRVSGPPRIQNHRVLPVPPWEPAQHTKADPVLFHASATSSAPASGDSSAEETYFSRIRRLLASAKKYPASARSSGVEGRTVIGFSINRQGYITRKAEVFRSSGSPVLDQAATACVEKVDKFPPFPDTFKEDLLKIRVDLVFELKGKS
jgi:TonB family protein